MRWVIDDAACLIAFNSGCRVEGSPDGPRGRNERRRLFDEWFECFKRRRGAHDA
jgi:hypothetical protein